MLVSKHIIYWSKGSAEDLKAANDLLDRGHKRQSLFFLHLSLEKLLKAIVCKHTGDIAPRLHNLTRLAEIAGAQPPEEIREFLSMMNEFNIEGRYPLASISPPTKRQAVSIFKKSKVVAKWLKALL